MGAQPMHVLAPSPGRDGALGLAAGLGLLLYIARLGQGGQPLTAADGLLRMLGTILGQACGFREAHTSAKLACMLLFRTWGSFWVSQMWGRIVASIVEKRLLRLRGLAMEFAIATTLLAGLNGLLKYYIGLLRLEVRERVTHWCHEAYLRPQDMVYYRANHVARSRVEGCDHLIASDIERFATCFAEVLSQSMKPVFDMLVYSVVLSRRQGLLTPLTLYSWFAGSSLMCSRLLPPLGALAATEQFLEGQFRSKHTRLIANSEQVAFLGGEQQEKGALNQQFQKLMDHCRSCINQDLDYEVVNQYCNKYFVTVIGLYLVSRPIRLGRVTETSEYFGATWRNMELMSRAIQDLFKLSGRMGKMSGYARNVGRLMGHLEACPPMLEGLREAAAKGPYPPTFLQGEVLKFDHVSVYKPDGTLLVRNLNMVVERGQRVLITGDNGCGKSSLFRVIRGLWPLVEGTITMPAADQIHFLTQANFVPTGTLRDLVIYPHTREEMLLRGQTDKHIHTYLKWAHVSPRAVVNGRAELEFVGGERPELDDVRDWQKDLSPGQKQRLAFARLFYHRPSYVVLDECTNGVSPDVEHDLYDRCAKLQLGVFSIAHKIELKLFHDFELHYNGDPGGSWTLTRCSETLDKVTRSSAMVKRLEPDAQGKAHSKICYERHVWFVD